MNHKPKALPKCGFKLEMQAVLEEDQAKAVLLVYFDHSTAT